MHILPFAFEEQHSAVSAHFTSTQKLPFAIQKYSDPENPVLIRKNPMDVLEKSEHYWGSLCQNFKLIRKKLARNSVLQKRAKNNKFKVPLKTQYIWAYPKYN